MRVLVSICNNGSEHPIQEQVNANANLSYNHSMTVMGCGVKRTSPVSHDKDLMLSGVKCESFLEQNRFASKSETHSVERKSVTWSVICGMHQGAKRAKAALKRGEVIKVKTLRNSAPNTSTRCSRSQVSPQQEQ